MASRSSLDTFEKLTQMGDVTLYEPAGDSPLQEKMQGKKRQRQRYQSHSLEECISNLSTPKGPKPVLKSMLTTACERNCNYCPFRAGHSKTPRVTITPDSMAKAFDTLQSSGKVDGLFLSSGIIKGSVTTQDKLIDTVEIVRKRYHYGGYIHLKIMPGAEYDQLKRAMQLADRVSVNLEGATEERLAALAPKKFFFDELLRQIENAKRIKEEDPRIRASVVTQFVVGAVGDTDLELLSLSDHLYNRLGLARAYYSGFSPISGTPFEELERTPDIRERRLYQASFLLRDYAWDVEELPFLQSGNLRTDVDPKLAWAEANLQDNPIDIMHAERNDLLRLPGIGPKSADSLLSARHQRNIRDFGQLRKLGIRQPETLAPFILLDGQRPLQQMRLF